MNFQSQALTKFDYSGPKTNTAIPLHAFSQIITKSGDAPTGPRRKLTLDDHAYFTEVVAKLREDILADNDDAQAHYNLGAWLLSAGVFSSEAWEHITWRLFLEGVTGDYGLFPIEIWDGHDVTGKNLFLWLEQGIGDQILSASMFGDLEKRCKSLTVYCNRRVAPIFKRSFPSIRVCKPGEIRDFGEFDYQLTFSDAGNIVRTSDASFPKVNGYLAADQEKVAAFKAKYKTDKKLVGLSWRSNNAKTGDGKSIPFSELNALLNRKDVQFVSLQYAETDEERADTRLIHDTSFDQLCDMDTFAAQVAALDAVISTSNTALHVAGSLGVETLGLISRGGARNWYWFNERTESPWYPSVTLTRQANVGEWSYPISKSIMWG